MTMRRRYDLLGEVAYHFGGWLTLCTRRGRRRFAQDMADGGYVTFNVRPPVWLLLLIAGQKAGKEIRRFWRRLRNKKGVGEHVAT